MKRIYIADLFVDDPNATQHAFEEAARSLGQTLEVTSFQDGYDLFARTQEDPPDFVLLGFLLPTLSGPACCRLLKYQARFRGLPIYMTGWPTEEDLDGRLVTVGADGFLSKPLDSSQVAEALKPLFTPLPKPAGPGARGSESLHSS